MTLNIGRNLWPVIWPSILLRVRTRFRSFWGIYIYADLLIVFRKALDRVGDHADEFYETYREYKARERLGPGMFLRDSFSELPQVNRPLCSVFPR